MKKIFLLLVALLALGAGAQAQDAAVPWWNERVFYEIFVRSFYDSDGDGVGDLQGVIEKLDYLNDGDPTTTDDLGITGIWLMPVAEALSYHGYDTLDYQQIEQDYGTAEDFQQLMAAAHERGIAVIVDLVINHTSVEHPWFVMSAAEPQGAYGDYYVWAEDSPGTTGWHELSGRAYYGWFWGGMPDLNYTNPAVTDEMHEIARFWLEEMGVDGFRLDAIKYIIEEGGQLESTPATLDWLADFHAHVEAVKPDALMVGEVYSGSLEVEKYVPEAVDIAFEFDLAAMMIDSVRRRSSQSVLAIQQRALELYPPGQYAAFLTNHDQNRVMTELRGDVRAAKLAASILLTNPGVPFIYYGEEIGMSGQKPDERIRTPMQWTDEAETAGFSARMPWQPLDANYARANVAQQDDDPESLLNHYRQLVHLRNAHPALQHGEMWLVESPRQVYSFVRHNADETLLVVINLHTAEVMDYTLALAEGSLNGTLSAEVLFGAGEVAVPVVNAAGGFDEYTPLAVLPPRSTLVVKLQ